MAAAVAAGDDDHRWCPWQDDAAVEHPVWVPVRAHKLAYLSDNIADVLQSRRLHRLMENDWEAEAAAAGEESPDADRSLDLACRLRFVMSESESSFLSMLGFILGDLDAAVHPRRRPRPGSAVWWRWCGGLSRMRFVHLSRGDVARARGLLADALERARRLRAPLDDLRWISWGPPAVAAAAANLHATPRLVERLRHAQRLADAVLVPLHELKRFVDHVLATNEPRRRGGGRGPSKRADAAARPTQPMIRRSASM